jgi:nucleoside 2-deoxyribosyltransferase
MPAKEVQLKPGWLKRQFDNVEREVASWSPSMRREAGFDKEEPMITGNNAPAGDPQTSGFVAPAESPLGAWQPGIVWPPPAPAPGWPMRTDLPVTWYSGPAAPVKTFLAYLTGPIRGMTVDECRMYFNYAASLLPYNILPLSPLRFRAYGGEDGGVICDSFEDEVMGTQKGIMNRDYFDVQRADVVIANFLGAKVPSIGSMFELAWCHQMHKPVVLVMESEGNVHDHPFVREACDFRVTTIEEAVVTAVKIVSPGV